MTGLLPKLKWKPEVNKMKSFLLIFLFSLSCNAKVLDKIYAVVNDEIITDSDISTYLQNLKTNNFINDILFFDPEEKKKAIESKDYLLKKLIDEKIIESQIKKLNIVITPEETNAEIDRILKAKGITKADLAATLKKEKKSFIDYQDFIKKSIERKALIAREIQSKIKISDEDVVSFYVSKKGKDSTQIYEYELEQMSFRAKSPDQLEPSHEKAMRALSRLKSNEDFKKVSIDTSDDGESIEFGKFKSGEMRPEIEKSVSNLKMGEFSEVVQTPVGFQIFKMKKKSIINDPDLAKAKPQIQQILLQNAYKDHLDYWLSQKRSSANIQINGAKN